MATVGIKGLIQTHIRTDNTYTRTETDFCMHCKAVWASEG